LNEMQQNVASHTFLKHRRNKTNDLNSISCSQIEIYSSTQ